MKKIIIIRNAFSFDFGGGERMPVNIANEISKQGFETIIISRNYALLDFAKKSSVKTLKGLWWSRQDWSGHKIIFTPIYFIWLFFVFLWYLSLFLVNKLLQRSFIYIYIQCYYERYEFFVVLKDKLYLWKFIILNEQN